MTQMFQQVFGSSLYQIDPGTTGSWCGYMLSPADTNPNAAFALSTALSLASGALRGSFLFAPVAPTFASADEANSFVAAVQHWLVPSGSFTNRFLVWLPVAGTAPVFGAATFAAASGYFAVPFSPQTAGFALSQTLNVGVGISVTLVLGTNVVLQASMDGSAISLPFYQASAISLSAPPSSISITIQSPASIPLAGPLSGCVVLGGTSTTASPMTGMLAGLQFAYTPAGGGPDVVQQFPVLDSSRVHTFKTSAAFDPLDPFSNGSASKPSQGVFRTIITVSQEQGTPQFPSTFRSRTNQPVTLLPRSTGGAGAPAAWDGGFVFQPTTRTTTGNNGLPNLTSVYLSPAGDFVTSVPGSTAPLALLGGLAGTETVQLQPSGGDPPPDILRFAGGAPAYTPAYPFPTASLAQPASGIAAKPLQAPPGAYITSWVQVVAGGAAAPTYSAQPRGTPLFGPDGTDGDSTYSIVGALQPVTAAGTAAFPLVPWSAANGGIPAAGWDDYDSNVLSATRRAAIQTQSKPALRRLKAARLARTSTALEPVVALPAAVAANGTTPQGLLAQIETSQGVTVYDAVVLAQSNDSGQAGSQMAFYDLNAELQGLFQTSQLFAVIIDPTNLGSFSQSNTVDIAGWTMTANVGQAASGSSGVSNVMILKFCAGTLLDIVAKPSAWVDPTDFSKPDPLTGVAVLSQALQTYIQAAIDAAASNPLYANFAVIARDPGWQGVLVLGADLTVANLPDQLAGLAAGIDFSTFRAHHFGVTVSPVTYGETLSIQGSSSMFGLIDYELPAYAANLAAGADPLTPLGLPAKGGYGFVVLQLQVRFDNSAMTDFRSHVQVTTDILFGSNITAAYVNNAQLAANSVVLTGVYQRQGQGGTYLFESDVPTVMISDSNIVNAVVLTKLIFNTLSTSDGQTPPNIRSRILIWGAIDFTILQRPNNAGAFDILSYGTTSGSPGSGTEGLAFSNLHIELTSPVATPNTVSYRVIENGIAFDQVSSTTRDGSLAPGLALQPSSFVAAAADATPASLGYLPVRLEGPAPPQQALTGAWYAISFLVNMGGPGALAATAGFTSHLIVGWSPQTTRSAAATAVFVGLQLPGASPGASTFSLQGVINLTVGSISLALAPVAGSDTTQAFTLRLRNIALSFLGVVKLPPSATIDMFLFGEPSGTGSLGWYAAYVEATSSSEQIAPAEA